MRKGTLFLALLALLALPCASWSRNVSVVLVSGDVVKGKLLGSGNKGIILQTKTGKARTYPFTSVQDVFDTDTNENLSSEFLKKGSVAPADEEQEAPVPARTHVAPRSTVKARPVATPTGPVPFKPGLSFGMDFTTGTRGPNNQLTTMWQKAVPEAGWDYFKMPLTDLGAELTYKAIPELSVGVFGQWFIFSLGNNQTLHRDGMAYWWYGVYFTSDDENRTFDLSLGAMSYGGMVRLRPSADSRVALALYAGQLSLVGAGYTVTSDNYGTIIEQNFSGSAPYFRGDIEYALTPNVSSVVPVLSIGYQSCKIKTVHEDIVKPSGMGSGDLAVDANGEKVQLDFSSIRLGFKVVGKF